MFICNPCKFVIKQARRASNKKYIYNSETKSKLDTSNKCNDHFMTSMEDLKTQVPDNLYEDIRKIETCGSEFKLC